MKATYGVAVFLVLMVGSALSHSDMSSDHVHYPTGFALLQYLYDAEAVLISFALLFSALLLIQWGILTTYPKWTHYLESVGKNDPLNEKVRAVGEYKDADVVKKNTRLSVFGNGLALGLFGIGETIIVIFMCVFYAMFVFYLEILHPVFVDEPIPTDPTQAQLESVGSQHFSYYWLFIFWAVILVLTVLRNVFLSQSEHNIETSRTKFKTVLGLNIANAVSKLLFLIFLFIANGAIQAAQTLNRGPLQEASLNGATTTTYTDHIPSTTVIVLIIATIAWIVWDIVLHLCFYCYVFLGDSVLSYYYEPAAGYLAAYTSQVYTEPSEMSGLQHFVDSRRSNKKSH